MAENTIIETSNDQTVEATKNPFLFHGQGLEFFKIWITNVFLTIITIGIYSPWAIVRTKRYFYGNTQLMNATFDYHADPFKILIGRIIAVILLVIFSIVSAIHPILYLIAIIALYAALPWIINKSLRFNAYNTSYRNIRFNFKGTYATAFTTFIIWPILGMLSIFILMPLAIKKQQEYIANNSLYGRTNFKLTLPTGMVYLYSFISLVITAIIATVIYVSFLGFDNSFLEKIYPQSDAQNLKVDWQIYSIIIAFYAGLLISILYLFVMMTNLMYNNLILANNHFKSSLTIGSYAILIITNILLLIITLGLATPWVKIRNARYMASKLHFIAGDNLEQFVQSENNNASALGEQIGEVFELGI